MSTYSKKRKMSATKSQGSSAADPIDLTVSNDKALAVKINRIIKKQTESKKSFHSMTTTAFNSGISNSGDVLFCCPNIGQGTAENERIGDEVKAQSLRIDGILTMNLSNSGFATACRIGVRVMVVQPKAYSSVGIIQSESTTWLAQLLKKGGTEVGFTGIPSDLYADINTNSVTKYYDKVFYLNQDLVNSTVGAVGVNYSTKFFTINLKLRNKLLRYAAAYSGGITAINYNPCLLVGYVHLDGSAPDTVTTQLNMSYISRLMYEDA